MWSKETSNHNLFALDVSHHGNLRIQSASSPPRPLTPLESAQEQLQQHIRILGQPATGFDSQLLRAAVSAKPTCRNAEGFQLELLRVELCKQGYMVELKVVTPEPAAMREARHMLENLHHQYLFCTGTRSAPGTASCIIEPRCREQFQIAKPTAAYQRIVRQVPEVFVGSPGRLHGLVTAISPAMAEAFTAQNTPLPPWRKQLSMLTKWSLRGPAPQQPAAAAQTRRGIPAFAQNLQLLQEALDSGRIPPTALALPDRMADLSRQLTSAQTAQPDRPGAEPRQRTLHLQPAHPSTREATGTVLAQQLPTHEESPPDAQEQQPIEQHQQTRIGHCFGGPRTHSPQDKDAQPPDHPDHERSQRRGSRLAFLAPYLKRNSHGSTGGDPSASGHHQQQQEQPAAEQKEGSKSRRRGARAKVHVVKPLPEIASGGQPRDGAAGPTFPWLWGGGHAEVAGGKQEGSRHDRSRWGGSRHDRSRHDRSMRDSSKHDRSLRDGSRHDRSLRDSSKHDKSWRDGSKHDRSTREGSKHDSSTHEGSRHVHDISAQASPAQVSQLFQHYEGQAVRQRSARQPWSPLQDDFQLGPIEEPHGPTRPASSLLAKALKKMVTRTGQAAADRSGSARHPSRRGVQ